MEEENLGTSYENKGDAQDCSNNRGIKLMSHTMKDRKCTIIPENNLAFMPGRSTMEAIHWIRKIIEYYRRRKTEEGFAHDFHGLEEGL